MLDKIPDLAQYADNLDHAVISTIESGKMTKDLALITNLTDVTTLDTLGFIKEVKNTFEAI